MRRSLWAQIIEAIIISFAAWWTLAAERGEKPAATCWFLLLRILRATTAFLARAVLATERAYYRAVTA